MQLIVQELGSMFVGAIPTMILFIVLVVAYQLLVQGPLTATLKRRRELTEGAMEAAQKAIAEAETRTAEYATKLRQARAEVYKIREQRMKQWNAERETALDAARKAAESAGGKLHAWYLTMGHYDAVFISEFPDDNSCAKFTLSTGSLGNVTTQTLKAFTEPEFRKIVGSLS